MVNLNGKRDKWLIYYNGYSLVYMKGRLGEGDD